MHLKNILEANTKAFKGNRQMDIDLKRLKKAKRVGPGCVRKMCTEKADC